jgi:hypothetical protein
MSRRWVPDVARPNHRAYLLLTRLFLRQFLENDLSSPDGDRSQMLAVLGASAVSLTLFISMFMSAGYAMSIMMPGQAAVLTLSDKFFYISLAMLATGMVAASQWDALSLDQRDIAILQPLPVRPAMLRLAKLSAVAALGGGVALGVNVFPTFIFPWMLGFAVPQMAAGQLLWLMIVHLTITVTAAVFGFLVVIALRESFSALLGATLFGRVSPWLQTSVIVLLGIALLLIPIATTRVGQRGFEGWRLMLPSTAFVGAYEIATQGFLDDLPRRRMTVPQENRDRAFSAIYAGGRCSPAWRGGRNGCSCRCWRSWRWPPRSMPSGPRCRRRPLRPDAAIHASRGSRGWCSRGARPRARGLISHSPPCGATRHIASPWPWPPQSAWRWCSSPSRVWT